MTFLVEFKQHKHWGRGGRGDWGHKGGGIRGAFSLAELTRGSLQRGLRERGRGGHPGTGGAGVTPRHARAQQLPSAAPT